jgi:hypothetical protein
MASRNGSSVFLEGGSIIDETAGFFGYWTCEDFITLFHGRE